jgi:hypothetical protein
MRTPRHRRTLTPKFSRGQPIPPIISRRSFLPQTLSANDQSQAVLKALKRIPTIGPATAQRLMKKFGESFLASMLGDNLFEFINLMDGNGELVFSDTQARRMERAMSNMEFGLGGYQPWRHHIPGKAHSMVIAMRPTSTRMRFRTSRPWACWYQSEKRYCLARSWRVAMIFLSVFRYS